MADLTFTSYLAPAMLPVYEAIAAHIGHELGLTTEVVARGSHASYGRDGSDVSFVCGLPYVLSGRVADAPAVPVAAPVPVGERYGGRPVYFADVVVAAASDLGAFADLAGRTWAYNEPTSLSGYGLVRQRLVEAGTGGRFFGAVIESGSHAQSMAMVADGRADGAAIDSHVLDLVRRDAPALADSLRVVAQLGPAPTQPVTLARRLPDQTQAAITAAFGRLHESVELGPVLADGLIERFVPVGPDLYDPIRAMVAAAAAAGLTDIR